MFSLLFCSEFGDDKSFATIIGPVALPHRVASADLAGGWLAGGLRFFARVRLVLPYEFFVESFR